MVEGSMLVICVCLYMLIMISLIPIHLITLVFCPRHTFVISFIQLEWADHQSDIWVTAIDVADRSQSVNQSCSLWLMDSRLVNS